MSLPEINELSERERDILRLVATGAGNKQIAAQLYISTNTVKVHLRNIFAKIGVTSRTEAAMVAIRLGLVQSSISGAMSEINNPEVSSIMGESATLRSSQPGQSLGLDSSESEAGRFVFKTGRLSKRLVWGLGLGLLVLVAVLLVFGIDVLRNQTVNKQVSETPGPRLTTLTRWQARSAMPSARSGLAVVAYEDRLYAIGGVSSTGVSGVIERYDHDSDTWETLPSKPLPVADIQAVVIGGKIYVPGGRTPSGELTVVLEIFDPRTSSWERGADLPIAISAYALTAFEGRLYMFGGWDGGQFINSAYYYDPRSNGWQSLTPMPTPRGFAAAAMSGGKIFVIGGKDAQKTLRLVEVYSPDREGSENPWQATVSMPEGRYGMGISSVADIIYIVCGQGESDTPQPSLAFNAQTDTWQSFEMPPSNLGSGLGLALSGEYLFAVGGKTKTTFTAELLAYQVVYTVGIPVIIK